jgi:hypothetical protein
VAPEVAQRRLRQAELKPLVAALVSRLQAG